MMTSMQQAHSPYPGGIQHPGGPQGHPMPGMAVPHTQGQGQPGMPQHMQMGVSGPGGPQVSQAGAMMGGMPPGAGGPNSHAAFQHLNPQAQMIAQAQAQAQAQQQQAMLANPQFHMQQQQQMINHQRAQALASRQAMIQQQYSGGGMPIAMQNGMGGMTPAQFQAMRGGPMARPVNLPQHLQQQQQQVNHSLEQQQAAQAQQQQQQMMQIAMQQQANAQAQGANNNTGQPGQMNPQQMHNIQQAQIAAAQQQHQQGQAASASQPNPSSQAPSQPQGQPTQPNAPGQPQPAQPQTQQQPQGLTPQQAQAAAMMQQRQQGKDLRGQCLMKLWSFGDHLSSFTTASKPLSQYMANGTRKLAAQVSKQKDDLSYWMSFVDRFFSTKGVLRHSIWYSDENSHKQFEVSYPALPRYFHTHFESGVQNMQLITGNPTEKNLPNNGHYIASPKSNFIYWFDNGSQLVATGELRAHFDAEEKIELLEFITNDHQEYLPRKTLIEAGRPSHEWVKEWRKANNPDGKQSPEMNKKKTKTMKSPPQPPPDLQDFIPESKVSERSGVTPAVIRFFELAEVIVQMNPLFAYSHQNPSLSANHAMDQYITTVASNASNAGPQGQISGPRTPGMGNFPMGASPATAHLQLPGSPHVGGSPAQAPGMQHQQSQHGTSSSGPSANTSPNASNKRRRPSAVKADEETQVNGTQAKPGVKPSPRITKRQKPNNAS